MQVVVLHVPGLWKHPIEPISPAPEHAAKGEGETVVVTGLITLVVTTMARVVSDHGPTRKRVGAKTDDGDNACPAGHPHRKHADNEKRVAREYDAVEVADVV